MSTVPPCSIILVSFAIVMQMMERLLCGVAQGQDDKRTARSVHA